MARQTGYFRILEFEPDKGVLKLTREGLDDPAARLAYCEWNDFSDGEKFGVVHLEDTAYECLALADIILICQSNDLHQRRLRFGL